MVQWVLTRKLPSFYTSLNCTAIPMAYVNGHVSRIGIGDPPPPPESVQNYFVGIFLKHFVFLT